MPASIALSEAKKGLSGIVPTQSAAATEAIEAGAKTLPEVICECVFVLCGKYYRIDCATVARVLTDLLDEVECEREATLRMALSLFAHNSLDFVDCIIAASVRTEGVEVLTFDKRLNGLIGRMGGRGLPDD